MSLDDKKWRLNNLYRVIDKTGSSVPFRLNPIQERVIDCKHKRKIILKARQVGMSTLAVIDMLDDTLFTPNLSTGIVSYSLEHAQHIFKRMIGHALDTFLPELKGLLGVVGRSAREISFSNGSFLRVDTSLRGATYQNVLVSEYGKTCARTPMKAEEVITGTLNAVPTDGKITIESTGEGMEGYFSEMVLSAEQRKGTELSQLEYELLFFPWYEQKEYQLDSKIDIETTDTDYFKDIEEKKGIQLTYHQKYWYCSMKKTLGDKIKQEFPSTVQEAFLSKSDAYYFASHIEKAYNENRCLYTNLYDHLAAVHVAMDIGVNDLTVMIFFQCVHGEVRIIDYYEDSNKGVEFYAKYLLQDKEYFYHTIFLPHDSRKRDALDPVNTYERDFRKFFSHTATKFIVLPRTGKQELISYAKNIFNRCVFNSTRVKPLLDKIAKYRKKWHEPTGRYLEDPYHDINSNFADAFQYLSQGVGMIERGASHTKAMEKHKLAIENRRNVI